jgi:hypothetical protein
LVKKSISCRFSAASLILDRKLHNAPRARTLAAFEPLFPSGTGWRHYGERFVDLPYFPAGGGEEIMFGASTIEICVYFVVGRDV